MKRSPRVLTLVIGLAAALAGCDSLVEAEPVGIEVIENQLATPNGAVLFVNSLYQPLTRIYGGSGGALPMAVAVEATTDDGWAFLDQFDGLKAREISDAQAPLPGLWGDHLTGIARANIFLSRVDGIDFGASNQEELGDQLVGEAQFFRAFYYFNLVRLFGDVPLYTEEVTTIPEGQQPRTSTTEVYAQIKRDLEAAISLLPEEYTGGSGDDEVGNERGRITAGAARTLLAKVHLTLEDWSSVLSVSEPLGAVYSLRPDFAQNFYAPIFNTSGENRQESIMEVQFSVENPGPKSFLRKSFAPPGSRGGEARVVPTDQFYEGASSGAGAEGPNAIVQAFDEEDGRFAVTFSRYSPGPSVTGLYFLPEGQDTNGLDNPDREWFVNKYYANVNDEQMAFNIVVLRYAEVLLMRAEAHAELGQTGQAIALVNEIRERAGLSGIDAGSLTADETIEAVRRERRLEFAFEHKRMFDLNRWGILPEVLQRQGVAITQGKITTHPITGKQQVLFPVPNNEITLNPNACQNEGYGSNDGRDCSP